MSSAKPLCDFEECSDEFIGRCTKGDRIEFRREVEVFGFIRCYSHWGLYTSNGHVIHYARPNDEDCHKDNDKDDGKEGLEQGLEAIDERNVKFTLNSVGVEAAGEERKGSEDKEKQPEGKEKQPEDKEKQPEDKEKQPEDKEKQPEDKEKQPEGNEKQPEGKEKQPEGKEKQPEGKEKQPEDKAKQPGGNKKQSSSFIKGAEALVKVSSISSQLAAGNVEADIKIQPMKFVANGSKVRKNNTKDIEVPPRSEDDINRDVVDWNGSKLKYKLLNFNCRHFVNMIRYGEEKLVSRAIKNKIN